MYQKKVFIENIVLVNYIVLLTLSSRQTNEIVGHVFIHISFFL